MFLYLWVRLRWIDSKVNFNADLRCAFHMCLCYVCFALMHVQCPVTRCCARASRTQACRCCVLTGTCDSRLCRGSFAAAGPFASVLEARARLLKSKS